MHKHAVTTIQLELVLQRISQSRESNTLQRFPNFVLSTLQF